MIVFLFIQLEYYDMVGNTEKAGRIPFQLILAMVVSDWIVYLSTDARVAQSVEH